MSKNKITTTFIIGIAVALLLPLCFYLIANQLSKGKLVMPHHYGAEKTGGSHEEDGKTMQDTIWHKTADLELTNQLGELISLNGTLKSKILVIDFIFTNCTATCPQLSTHMRLLQTGFKKDPRKEASLDTIVQFISITVNPERDSVPVLRAYADKYGANHDHWWFLTGDKKTINNFARNELGLSTGQGDGGAEDFIHTEKFVLLDKNRNIRGYYNGTDVADVRKCADDVVLLTLEKKKGSRK